MKDALFQPESRAALRRIENLGYTDAFRALHPERRPIYLLGLSGGSWERNNLGIRIDHILLSPQGADRLKARAASTSICATAKSHRTMCQSGQNWTMRYLKSLRRTPCYG